jgi:hypothetical protein
VLELVAVGVGVEAVEADDLGDVALRLAALDVDEVVERGGDVGDGGEGIRTPLSRTRAAKRWRAPRALSAWTVDMLPPWPVFRAWRRS